MGGNVFADKTAAIKKEDISPTLSVYYAELQYLFSKKSSIFNSDHFIALGSTGKKAVSGDIDLGISSKDIVDVAVSDDAIREWGISPADVHTEFELLKINARTATDDELKMKAFFKMLTLHINNHAPVIFCDLKKVSAGNIFSLYPQYPSKNTGVQIDWMVGDIDWLIFSYYSEAYPESSNVKGLHRTQLMLSAFQVANQSFSHLRGIKDKATGEVIATDPKTALLVLGNVLGFSITTAEASNYYILHNLFKTKMKPAHYNQLINTYFKILESTRADIPDDLQAEWLLRKDTLKLTGKFLPENSALRI